MFIIIEYIIIYYTYIHEQDKGVINLYMNMSKFNR